MPDELNQISKDLDRIQKSAERAEQTVQELTAALENFIRASTQGGKPSEQALNTYMERYLKPGVGLSGAGALGRTIEGGAFVKRSDEIARVIDNYLRQIFDARLEAMYRNMTLSSLSTARVSAGRVGSPITASTVPTGLTPESLASPELVARRDTIAKLTREEYRQLEEAKKQAIAQEQITEFERRYAQLAREAVDTIRLKIPVTSGMGGGGDTGGTKFSRTGETSMPGAEPGLENINPDLTLKMTSLLMKITGATKETETLTNLARELSNNVQLTINNQEEWGKNASVVSTTIKQIENGYHKIATTIEAIKPGDILPRSYEISQYLGKGGAILNQGGYDAARLQQMLSSNVLAPIRDYQGISGGAKTGLETQIRAAFGNFDKYVGNVKNMYTAVTELDEGLVRFITVLRDLTGGEQKFVQFVRNGTQVLNEQQLQSVLTTEELLKQQQALERRLGAAGVHKLYTAAAERGFQPKDIKSVVTQEPSGVSVVKFRQFDEAAQMSHTLELSIDRVGNVLTRTNRRLQGFFESVVKNTAELIRWSIGVGLVYGSYYKFQQLVQLAISNQDKLVDVTISLGDAQRDSNKIFEDAADVADRTGESINDVLDAYTMTYRAVGGVSNVMEKTAASNKLLYESTVLNKLSALDSAESIDVLSGSLRQMAKQGESTAQSFERGTELLDKWVAVTRNANVDLATLATAFSVTAESALNAGLNVDQLNAVIASLSEKIGGLGGKETGNAVRALIGGVYQEQAAEILTKYGIAVTDTTGRMRNFLDISRDVFELYSGGIIDETQLNKIGYVLGGGVRRGQQYVAFLKDYQRIQEITTVQAGAAGQAQQALALKMDTVATSTTRVSNAFQSWAQTLGTEGGLLDTISILNNALGGTVEFINGLTKALGSVTIPATLLTFLALYGGFRDESKWAKISSPFQKFGKGISNLGFGAIGGGQVGYRQIWEENGMAMLPYGIPGYGVRGAIGRGVSGIGGFIGNYGPALALGALGAAPRVAEAFRGEPGAIEGSVANIGGAIAGGFVGNLILPGGPGALIGSTIGQAAGDAIYQNVLKYQPDFENVFREAWKIPEETTETNKKTFEELSSDFNKQLFKTYAETLGHSGAGGAEAGFSSARIQAWFDNLFKTFPGKVKGAEFQGVTPEMVALQQIKQFYGEQSKEYKELLAAYKGAVSRRPEVITPETSQIGQYEEKGKEVFGPIFETLLSNLRDEYQQQLVSGKMGITEYRTKTTGTEGALSYAVRWYGSINKLSGESLRLTQENEKEIVNLAKLYLNTSPEIRTALAQTITEWNDVSNSLESLKGKSKDTKDALFDMTSEELLSRQERLNEDLKNIAENLEKASAAALDFKLPEVYDLQGFTEEQLKSGLSAGQQALDQRAKEFRELIAKGVIKGISPQEFDTWLQNLIDTADPMLFDLGAGISETIGRGIWDAGFIQKFLQQSIQEGTDIGYQFLDNVTQEQLRALEPQYQAIRKAIINQGIAQGLTQQQAEGLSPETGLITFLQDPTSPIYMEKDWKIVQYLLQQILKTEEKQLDGIYNLPSGASFYVPFQAWKMDTETRQAMAQGAGGPTDITVHSDLQPPVDKFGQYVEEFGGIFAGMVGKYSRENLTRKDENLINELRLNEKWGTVGAQNEWGRQQLKEQQLQQQIAQARIDQIRADTRERIRSREDTSAALRTTQEATAKSIIQSRIWEDFPTDQSAAAGRELLGQPSLGQAGADLSADVINGLLSGIETGVTNLTNALTTMGSIIDTIKQGLGLDTGIPQTSVPQTTVPDVKTSLNIDLATQTQLIVDGRVLADIVKPYLVNDLVAYENSAGTSSATFTAV